MTNEQEIFWKGRFGSGYISRNSQFDRKVAIKAWKKMLARTRGVCSILECGSNIGRNLIVLKKIFPKKKLSLIEINREAFHRAVKNVSPEYKFNGSILESKFRQDQFDLCFTAGVLIHIVPEDLRQNMAKLYEYSKKYVLICEYFSRKPETIVYHGKKNKLFKRDYGKFFLENFKAYLLDYGFLWSHEYEAGGFDDMTWWLFKK